MQIVQWYHTMLCHPGETHTRLTISQNLYWKNLRKTVHDVCSKYNTCQFLKRGKIIMVNFHQKRQKLFHGIHFV